MVIIKIVIIYFLILLLMKFMGKREIGQLSLFDFAVIMVIADIAVVGLESDHPFYYYIIGIVVLGLIQKLLAYLQLKIPKIRDFFDGKQSLIIIEGKINVKEMRRQNYNITDLIIQLRLKNIRSISEVRYLILEANGEISVYKFSDFESNQNQSNEKSVDVSSRVDIKKNSEAITSQEGTEIYPFPVIVSGVIDQESLKILNLSEDFVMKEIKRQGYKSVKDIYYANYENGKLFIAQTCDF